MMNEIRLIIMMESCDGSKEIERGGHRYTASEGFRDGSSWSSWTWSMRISKSPHSRLARGIAGRGGAALGGADVGGAGSRGCICRASLAALFVPLLVMGFRCSMPVCEVGPEKLQRGLRRFHLRRI